ncbi:MAG: hypothetical protein ACP5TY_06360 [Thermodesulforhabdaceae bacterium]
MSDREAISILKELIDYIENNYVFDRVSDSGCGGVDPHRSEAFQSIIDRAKDFLQKS